jgi:hypothetical protein
MDAMGAVVAAKATIGLVQGRIHEISLHGFIGPVMVWFKGGCGQACPRAPY